jgi:putative ABC transport system permease protein
MVRLAWRAVLAGRNRFLLPLVAVTLGVAFVSGALLYGGSVRAVLDGVRIDHGVEVTGDPVPAGLVTRLGEVDGVASVTALSTGRVFLLDKDNALVGPPGAAAGTNFVAGRHTIVAGHAPSAPGEVAVDDWSARRSGYRVGDRIRVIVNGTVHTVTLAGVLTASSTDLVQGGTLTTFDAATARGLFGGYTELDLTAAPGTSDSVLLRRVSDVLPDDVYADHPSGAGADNDKLTTILTGFAAVALFVAVFLVAGTFTMLAAARAREHALLRAVGASRRHVLRTVLAEAVLLGLVATVLGHLLGVGVAAGLSRVFGVTGGPPVPLRVLSAGPVLAALAVGVGATVVAAYVPARRAAAVPPVAALRSGVPPTSRSLRRRNIVGAVMTVAGAGTTFAAGGNQDLVYLGAPLLMLGLVVLTPLAGLALTALVRGPLRRFAGIRGTLAVENTRRNPRRTASTASALMIGLAICAAVSVPIASVSAQSEREADAGDNADIRVTPIDFADLGPEVPDRIAGLPGVLAVTPVAQQYLDLSGNDALDVAAVNPATFPGFVPLTVRAGSLDRLASGIAVTSEEAGAHHWRVGSAVTGSFDGTRVSLPVVAIYDAPATFAHGALTATTAVPAGTPPQTVLVMAAPGRATALARDIEHALRNPALVVQTRDEYRAAAGARFDVFLDILYALLSVTVLIGALAVVNTMTMSVWERVREIGLLRAIGLSRRQVASVLRLESVVIALLGAVLGLGAGCLIGAAVVLGQDGLPLVVPWPRLGVLVLVTTAIGVLASLWPARKAARLAILTAIAAE